MTEDMDRVPLRVPDSTEIPDKLRIGVAGFSPGAGASFTAGLIASRAASAEKTSLIELGAPYFYLALGMEKRFAGREFRFFRRCLEGKESIRRLDNTEESINWLLREPRDRDPLPPQQLFRLINAAPGAVCVFDCSGLSGDTLEDVLAEMDSVVLVCDPLPSALIGHYRSIDRLQILFPDAIRVLNKMNPGVHKTELKRFLARKDYLTIPMLEPRIIYEAEYSCCLPYGLKGAAEILKKPSEELLGRLDL